MKIWGSLLLGCLFVAAGIYLLVQDKTGHGVLGVVFGLTGIGAAVIRRRG